MKINVVKRFLYTILYYSVVGVVFLNCNQPIGLGNLVNTEVPVIRVPEGEAGPGSFLTGDSIIWLDVEQRFGVDRVFMEYWWMEDGVEQGPRIKSAVFDEERGQWFVEFDTTDYPDGNIRTRVTAIDVDGNSSTTTDMIFTVKNTPPQIEMTMPRLGDADFDSPNLNSTANIEDRVIFQGGSLMGIASDLMGIYGSWPQIMIWPALNHPTITWTGTPDANDAPVSDTQEWGQWRVLHGSDGPLSEAGLRAVQFRWPLDRQIQDPDGRWRLKTQGEISSLGTDAFLPSGDYNFRIRVKDMGGKVNVYPSRIGGTDSNEHITFRIAAAQNPIIRWACGCNEHTPGHAPEDCIPFPNFYNLSGYLVGNMQIVSGNTIIRVRAAVTASESAAENDWIAGVVIERDSLWQIRIPHNHAQIPSASGDFILHVEALDDQGNVSITSRPIIFDIDPPSIHFIEPMGLNEPEYSSNASADTFPRVTSTVIFRGVAEDNQRVSRLFYSLGVTDTENGIWHCTGFNNPDITVGADLFYHGTTIRSRWGGSLSSWEWRFEDISDIYNFHINPINSNNPFLEVFGEPEDNLWKLPVKFRVIDFAGNTATIERNVIVDPDADRPSLTISSHRNGDVVGGEVWVNGMAIDNNVVHSVRYRVSIITSSGTVPVHDWRFIQELPQNTPAVGWNISLNSDNALSPVEHTCSELVHNFVNGVCTYCGSREFQDVLIEFQVWDASMFTPNIPIQREFIAERLTLRFSNTVPVVENRFVIFSGPDGIDEAAEAEFEHGHIVNDFFTIRAVIRDDQGIVRVEIMGQEDRPTFSPVTRYTPSTNADPQPWIETLLENQDPQSDRLPIRQILHIPINSNTAGFFGGAYYNRAGTYQIDIRVTDNHHPPNVTINTIVLRIDNFFPTAALTSANLIARGNNYTIAGTATDHGTGVNVFSVERVVVYLTRENGLVNLRDGSLITNTNSFITNQMATDGANVTAEGSLVINPQPLPVFPNVLVSGTFPNVTTRSDYGIVVIPPDRILTTVTWETFIDTTAIPDGPVTLNYVVFDHAGNATHYSKEIYIANNPPVISSLTLGTDISPGQLERAQVALTPNAGGIATNFTVRNSRFVIEPMITDDDLPNNLNTQVAYVILGPPIQTLVRGNDYVITSIGERSQWINFGVLAHSLDINVGDTFTAMTGGSLNINHLTGATMQNEAWVRPIIVVNNSGDLGTDIQNFDGIEDTDVNEYRLFKIKVTDSTPAHGWEWDTDVGLPCVDCYDGHLPLSNVRLIRVSIANSDTTPPTIHVAPFGHEWTSQTTLRTVTDEVVHNQYLRNIVHTGIRAGLEDITPDGTTRALRELGYVQFPRHNTTEQGSNANISGMVIFNGIARDDQRISHITAQIDGYNNGNAFRIAEWSESTNRLEPVTAGNDGTIAAMSETDPPHWAFEIISPSLTLDAHTLNWRFAFDTSRIATVVANNVNVRFAVHDFGNNGSDASDAVTGTTENAANNATHTVAAGIPVNMLGNRMVVNIVPYITEIVTPLNSAMSGNPSTFNRSALGWYPVHVGNSIIIKGFNFYTGSSTVSIAGTAIATVIVDNSSQITAVIPVAANSGALAVTVNGIESFNNRNNNIYTDRLNRDTWEARYNWEPNELNNNILTDDRNLYIWATGAIGTIGGAVPVAEISDPFFRMDNAGNRMLSYGFFPSSSRGRLRVNRNGIDFNAAIANTNRMTNTTVATGGSNNSWFAMGSDITAGNFPFVFGRSNPDGTGRIPGATGSTGENTADIANTGPFWASIIDPIGTNSNRFRIPRIAVRPTTAGADRSDISPDRVLISYFDGTNDRIELIFGTVGTNDMLRRSSALQVVSNTGNVRGSEYTAVGLLDNGLPVIAWYDRINQNLMFSYATAVPGTTNVTSRTFTTSANAANTAGFPGNSSRVLTFTDHRLYTGQQVTVGGGNNRWVFRIDDNRFRLFSNAALTTAIPATGTAGNVTVTVPAHTVPATPTLATAVVVDNFRGTDVDLVVDGNNNIHMAYFDVGNGGLYYAFIPVGANGLPNVSEMTRVRVDTFLSAGVRLMINVREQNDRYVPFISYAHRSFAGTRNSIRVAWLVDDSLELVVPGVNGGEATFHGTDASDKFTGTWEVMTVPVSDGRLPNIDHFVCNGVPTSNTGWTDVSGSGFNNIQESVMVTYMTDTRYEGAVLRANLLTLHQGD